MPALTVSRPELLQDIKQIINNEAKMPTEKFLFIITPLLIKIVPQHDQGHIGHMEINHPA